MDINGTQSIESRLRETARVLSELANQPELLGEIRRLHPLDDIEQATAVLDRIPWGEGGPDAGVCFTVVKSVFEMVEVRECRVRGRDFVSDWREVADPDEVPEEQRQWATLLRALWDALESSGQAECRVARRPGLLIDTFTAEYCSRPFDRSRHPSPGLS